MCAHIARQPAALADASSKELDFLHQTALLIFLATSTAIGTQSACLTCDTGHSMKTYRQDSHVDFGPGPPAATQMLQKVPGLKCLLGKYPARYRQHDHGQS